MGTLVPWIGAILSTSRLYTSVLELARIEIPRDGGARKAGSTPVGASEFEAHSMRRLEIPRDSYMMPKRRLESGT